MVEIKKVDGFYTFFKRSIKILFFLSVPVVSACAPLWPAPPEREHSLKIRRESRGEYLSQSELVELLRISESRYQALARVGGEHCLPGRMQFLKQEHQQIRLALDAQLRVEPLKRLEETFVSLDGLRIRLENQLETTGCPLQYVLRKKARPNWINKRESLLGLGRWAKPESLP